MSTRSRMQEAQALIRDKRFDEARHVLVEIDHPLAHQWLNKVNQISPPKQTAKTSKSPLPPDWQPKRAPWNPSSIYGFCIVTCAVIVMGNLRRNYGFDLMGNVTMTLVFIAVLVMVCLALGSIVLAYNWRRLGQPQWFGDTALIAVFVLVILILLAVGAFYTADHNMVLPFAVTFIGLLAWIGLTFSFGNGLAMAQLGAFNKWQAHQSGKVLLKYQYNFSGAKTNGVMITLALAAVGAGLYFTGLALPVYETADLRFPHPPRYQQTGCESFTDDPQCLMSWTRDTAYGDVYLTLWKMPLGGASSAAAFEEASRSRHIAENPTLMIYNTSDLTIDGYEARLRDASHSGTGCPVTVRRVYVLVERDIFQFVMSTCTSEWDFHRSELEAIIDGVDFKAN